MSKFKPNTDLTQSAIKELLEYNPETGLFFWKKARPRIHIGMQAGSLTPEGYIRITVDGHRCMGHILAWLYMTGEYLIRGIDHRDTIRSNNKWRNLRKASKSQNRMNTRPYGSSGRKGVMVRDGRRPYAQITLPGQKHLYLGSFDTVDAAAARYEEEAVKHFGSFARAQ